MQKKKDNEATLHLNLKINTTFEHHTAKQNEAKSQILVSPLCISMFINVSDLFYVMLK